MEYPETSRWAQLLSFLSIALVYVSILTLFLEAVLEGEENSPEEDAEKTKRTEDEDWARQRWQLLRATQWVDTAAIAYFSLEFMARSDHMLYYVWSCATFGCPSPGLF